MRLPTWPSSMQWHSSSMCRHDSQQRMCSTAPYHEAADSAGMIRADSSSQGKQVLHAAGMQTLKGVQGCWLHIALSTLLDNF